MCYTLKISRNKCCYQIGRSSTKHAAGYYQQQTLTGKVKPCLVSILGPNCQQHCIVLSKTEYCTLYMGYLSIIFVWCQCNAVVCNKNKILTSAVAKRPQEDSLITPVWFQHCTRSIRNSPWVHSLGGLPVLDLLSNPLCTFSLIINTNI